MNNLPVNEWIPITDLRWSAYKGKIRLRRRIGDRTDETELQCSMCSRGRIKAFMPTEWMVLPPDKK